MRFFKIFSVLFSCVLIVIIVWLFRLNHTIQKRIENGWFRPPVEIYGRGERFQLRQNVKLDALQSLLTQLRYRERFEDQPLLPNDFSFLDSRQCTEVLASMKSAVNGSGPDAEFDERDRCIYLRTPENTFGPMRTSHTILMGLTQTEVTEPVTPTVSSTVSYLYQDGVAVPSFELNAPLFAQFYDGEPLLRNVINIGDAPLECLQAVTAIEDSQFLDHKGISVSGLARAFVHNILSGRYAQGGSTITQQLIKNYFLTPEKTLKRKISELAMAVLLELDTNKDQILESYLNVVYMGQRGPFQVIGLGSASEYYFSKPLGETNLAECALLAAIINNPGRYNPFTNGDNAAHRRSFVLDRMVETNMITAAKAIVAKSEPLPKANGSRMLEPATYYTQAIFRELKKLGLNIENGLRIYSTLDISAQDIAQKKVREHIINLEKNNKKLAALKASKGQSIEASLISVDVATGEVLALVGGRQYTKTQYNRVLDAHRQIGSVMKPFVFLTALESRQENGEPYHPTTLIDDASFSHKYEGQTWSPQNYDKENAGVVPLFYALKNSLNAATAKLGLQVGLSNIIDVARRAGYVSELKAFPSLTLGAFEIYPWEVATGLLTVARMGQRTPLLYIRSAEDWNGKVAYQAPNERSEAVFSPQPVAELIGMMKQTLLTGTARASRLWGFTHPAAGKTGTTSDTKDTWFTGFTPYVLTVTWTGYDDNTPTGLTGASGALPLWTQFMKAYATRYPADDFTWPDGVEKIKITPDEFKKLVTKPQPYELENPVELIDVK